jgi:hypothetical protein
MNTHAALLIELALRHERRVSKSDSRRAWHLEMLRQSRAEAQPRALPWWRTVRDLLGGWAPTRRPSFPPTSV